MGVTQKKQQLRDVEGSGSERRVKERVYVVTSCLDLLLHGLERVCATTHLPMVLGSEVSWLSSTFNVVNFFNIPMKA